MIVILWTNRDFIEYMRESYPDNPLSEFQETDTYVCPHGGVTFISPPFIYLFWGLFIINR
jgi:hypothetical protein